MYAMVDDSDSLNQRIGAMPNGHSVPAVLQRANRIWQGRVLETPHDVLVLWALLARSPLPRLLPPALRSSSRGGIVTGALLLPPRLLDGLPPGPVALCVDALSRSPPVVDARIHLVATQP